jgi:TatD DNase family protein
MKFINLHSHNTELHDDEMKIYNQFPSQFLDEIPFFSIGIHPWHIEKSNIDHDLKIISNKMQLKNCLALGECGLDNKIEKPLLEQIQIFESQIEIAQHHNKPIILHCVGTHNEIISIKKLKKIDVPMIIHGFNKNINIAKMLLDNGFYLSFGKNLILNPAVQNIFKEIPIDKIFLETDNSSFSIFEIYKIASECKKINIETLKSVIYKNYKIVFG